MLLILLVMDILTANAFDDGWYLASDETKFSFTLFEVLRNDRTITGNIVVSPDSIYNALLTLYVASAGKTEKSMEKFLRFEGIEKPSKKYITERLLNETNSTVTTPYELVSLDRIYYTSDYKVKPDKQKQFSEKVAVFKSEDEINNWVSNYTKGNITNLLKKGSIKDSNTIVSVNAAYFKGYWKTPINGGTYTKPFTLSDGTVKEMLFMSLKDNYFQSMTDPELKVSHILLPYKGDHLFMLITVPTIKPVKNGPSSIADVVKKLDYTTLKKIVSDLKKQEMCTTDLLIPKFEIEENYKLKSIFENMGDKELFTQEMDLTNIFEPGKPTTVADIVHQAKIRVYENGTEAASGTGILTMGSPPPKCPTTFHADTSFVFFIFTDIEIYLYYHYLGVYDPK